MEIERNMDKGVTFKNVAVYGTFDYEDCIYIKVSDTHAIEIGGKSEMFFNDTIVKPCIIEKISVSE